MCARNPSPDRARLRRSVRNRRTMELDLALAVGTIVPLIPTTLTGLASIRLTIALREGSTVVVLNALSLLGSEESQA